MRTVRDAALVAAFDLGESLRSRKVIAILVLYVAGAAGAAGIFLAVLRELENSVAARLMVAGTTRPGTLTEALLESEEFRSMLEGLVGDRGLAGALVRIPPLALLHGWLVFTFVPILVVMTSADAIAAERGSGSVRFALFRTDRLSWASGKLAGQAALMAIGIASGAAAIWLVGAFGWSGFEPGRTALWLLALSGRGAVHALAYLGLTLGVSQVVRGANAARALSLAALAVIGLARLLLQWDVVTRQVPVLAPLAAALLPGAHTLDLWRPAFGDRLPALVFLPAFGIAAFALGHRRFARSDA